jgi:HPr kinase/phosphorylase
LIRLPVRPGRNLAVLIEVAARNQALKIRGQHAARQFTTMVDREIRRTARHQRNVPAGGKS